MSKRIFSVGSAVVHFNGIAKANGARLSKDVNSYYTEIRSVCCCCCFVVMSPPLPPPQHQCLLLQSPLIVSVCGCTVSCHVPGTKPVPLPGFHNIIVKRYISMTFLKLLSFLFPATFFKARTHALFVFSLPNILLIGIILINQFFM